MIDKLALITGATAGIGKATAMALAKQGYTVVVHGRNNSKTTQVCEEIKAATANPNIHPLVADLFLLSEVRNMATAFKEKYGRLDVLVNNAGGLMSKERETTAEGFEKTMAVNLLAPFLLTELLLPLLKKSPEGRIVNVSSNSHKLNARPNFSDLSFTKTYSPLVAYGNTKLFLIWITQQLSQRLKQEESTVTVNTLHPGAVATGFAQSSNLGSAMNLLVRLMRPLFKTPEQGADTVIYLASADAVKHQSGLYFVNRKPAKVAVTYDSPKNRKRVWDYCEEHTKAFRD